MSSSRIEFLPAPVVTNKTAVAIIGTGPSFADIPFGMFGPNVHLIAVKGAIFFMPKADSWITVDANARCRFHQMSVAKRKRGTQYFAAVPYDYGTSGAVRRWHRPAAEPDIHYLERIEGVGLAEDPKQIITGNSAYAALGLAYHMGFKRVGIFGVDATQDLYGTNWGGRPRGDLGKLHALFADAIPQLCGRDIQVKNAGALRTWPSERPPEVIKWLNGA